MNKHPRAYMINNGDKKKPVFFIIFFIIVALVAFTAAALIITKPASKTVKKTGPSRQDRAKKVAASNRAAIVARIIAFPESLGGAGPPKIWSDQSSNDPAVVRFDMVEMEYPNGYHLLREYRHPDDATVNNFRGEIAIMKKDEKTFSGGRTYALIDINGHEALALEKGTELGDKGRKVATGATLRWYVKPFYYYLTGPPKTPLKKIVPVASEITEFAGKNIPQDLPPNAANTPTGYLVPDEATDTNPAR